MSRRGKRKFAEIKQDSTERIIMEKKHTEILDIGPLRLCKIINRPSVTIRSPYVADIQLSETSDVNTYLAHSPGLDCAGIMTNGSLVYCKDNRLVERVKKTSFSIQLISDLRSDNVNSLIGYHPQLAEDVSYSLLSKKLIPAITDVVKVEKQVTLGDSRIDFGLTTEDDRKILVEVKNVVCSEYLPITLSSDDSKGNTAAITKASGGKKVIKQCFIDPTIEYDVILPATISTVPHYCEGYQFKCGIFPHGKKKPKIGVVSERAIKHIENLIHLSAQPENRCVLLFIVNRNDCNAFRPGQECDLLFAQMVRKAINHGVKVLAQQVVWTTEGKAYLGNELPILMAKSVREEDIDAGHLRQPHLSVVGNYLPQRTPFSHNHPKLGMSKRKGDFEGSHDESDEIEVEDVSDDETSMVDGDNEELNVAEVEDEENVMEELPAMNDLDYIAQYIQTVEEEQIVQSNDSHNKGNIDAEVEEDESSDSESENNNNDQEVEKESEIESESESESDREVLTQARKEMKVWLTEEEEEGGLSAEVPPRTIHEISPDEVEATNGGPGNLGPEFPQRLEDIQLLSKIGFVLSVVRAERTVVIQAYPTVTPLNESSVICDQDGTVLGRIFEVFGPVTTPFYMIKIREQKPAPKVEEKEEDEKDLELSIETGEQTSPPETEKVDNTHSTNKMTVPPIPMVWDKFPQGTIVYLAPSYASYITPNLISSMKLKGSDASNAFDEEPPEDELEYSDDEQEMMAKRLKKKTKPGATAESSHPGSSNQGSNYSNSNTGRKQFAARGGRNPQTSIPHSNFINPSFQTYQPNPATFYPQPPLQPAYPTMQYQTPAAYPSSSIPQQHTSIYSSLQYPLPSTGPSMMNQTTQSTPQLAVQSQLYYQQQQQQQQMQFYQQQQYQQQNQSQQFQSQAIPPQPSNASTSYTLVYSPQLGTYQYLPTTIQVPNSATVNKPPEPPKPPAPNR